MKRICWIIIAVFILMNVVAFFHAYKFTHFSSNKSEKTESPHKLTMQQKIGTAFFGVNNPRPVNHGIPTQPFETIRLQSNKSIECWYIEAEQPKGTVILFHGYGGDKSSMLDKSDEFIKMGYSTLLVDFMGSGGSEGNQTTIGYKEAEQVKTSFEYIANLSNRPIYLFGTSMGAVAILKAINDFLINPTGIILECPFGSMYQTVCARFRNMNIPAFPMASLLVFWGGIQNGFWAFGHHPTKYARMVHCPTLLLYGEKDKNVSRQEIDKIFENLQGEKVLNTYESVGHENYLTHYKQQWIKDVASFMNKNEAL